MANMDEVSQIREKIDLVSFISEYLPLKKMGRNFKTNCPFHSEKTASFVVSPERQIWHCFGCGKGGDVFTFLMEYENMEFPESLRTLAKKAGIVLKESDYKKGQSFEKEKIFEINKLSLKFYNYILNEHKAGKKALEYLLEKRKLNKGIINTFQIGFAPLGNILSDYLIKKKNFKSKDLINAGISFETNGRVNDFFRGRIIFPLFDHRGNVAGFSARAMDDTQMPKYINTKETVVYHKGSMFFGLNLVKDEIKQKQDAIIVEGEFDAIALFKEGIKNAIAIKGTALTQEQVNLLSRFTPKVTFCLDQDSAGFEATKRSLAIIEKKELSANIITLKDGKDPDEAIKNNPIAFKKALKESVSIYDFLIDYYVSKFDISSIEGKKQITQNILPLLSQVSNEIVKEHYIKKLSAQIDTSLESMNKELGKFEKNEKEEKISESPKDKKSRRQILEEYLMALIIQSGSPKLILKEDKEVLDSYKFETQTFEKILDALNEYFAKFESFDNEKFSNFLSSDLIKTYDFCFLYPLPKFLDDQKYSQEVIKVIAELINLYAKNRVKEISEEIAKKEKLNEDIEDLKKEFSNLMSALKQVS
jgi:DNA primase